MTRVAVMGSGNWGTAFAAILADAGSDVLMWARRAEVADAVNAGRNEAYLPELALPPAVRATTDPVEALEGSDVVVLVVPSQTLRANLAEWGAAIPSGAPVVSLMKGVELGTTMRMSEVVTEAAGVEPDRVVVVSGPNLAPEIALRQPAGGVIACRDMATAERVAQACAAPYFRPYTDTDVVGAEVCGATKNVVALASGMAEGMGFGDNTKATIITRGLAETTRLGLALGAHPQTFMGLAGVGDLIATCMSPLSRNHSFGVRLGRGLTVEQATAEMRQTTEGVKSCESILTLAGQHGVDMPICEQVVAVIRDGHSARDIGPRLMSRDLKAEKR
ncbi:NAD(P)H-dependent glycerol-3-phosphate dehydrogenase [Terracoccus luteus]|uniref:Glycerol-3-phosphate dehydrogenase [NAD(P)+] n=1 Tax=Terracoccus luteus TaxID=53356 RepID=A0A839PR38_9MICO|nr:NAD(P)H-dependent glycerol-3-phosphate dehydrogenase [Terracoccus luteus]MBB2985294.1 glycerol-3-phosphate dehydrogenase (NAD(P)+) [Terracoccus luteus]MCP2170946.1 glycerol-3-phosphate dehydrogenase (NAD(P)+) [Terracoccus luteus]